MSQAPESTLLGKSLYLEFYKAEMSNTYYWKEDIKIMNSEPSEKGKDKVARIYQHLSIFKTTL